MNEDEKLSQATKDVEGAAEGAASAAAGAVDDAAKAAEGAVSDAADAVKAAAGEAAHAAPSPKKGKKKAGIVIGVIAAVVIVAGVGFFAWHEQPSFCNAICHTPMDGYLTTYEQQPDTTGVDKWGNEVENTSSMLAVVHAQEDYTCLSCHVPTISEQVSEGLGWISGNYEVVQTVDERFVPEEKSISDLTAARGVDGEAFCLNEACHTNDDGSVMTRDDLVQATSDYKRNPHYVQEGHATYACSDCHKAHRASTVKCSECHADTVIPDGWLSYSDYEDLEPVEVK